MLTTNSEMSIEVVTLTRLNFEHARDADGRKVPTIPCLPVKADQPGGVQYDRWGREILWSVSLECNSIAAHQPQRPSIKGGKGNPHNHIYHNLPRSFVDDFPQLKSFPTEMRKIAVSDRLRPAAVSLDLIWQICYESSDRSPFEARQRHDPAWPGF